METFLIVLATQCPVIIALLVFIFAERKQNHRQFERQAEQFQVALDKVVTKIGERLDRIEYDLKTHIVKK
jgi:Flp pilus assembly protein TadB